MERRWVLIDASGNVDNIIVLNQDTAVYAPPAGIELREADTNAEPGGTWNGSEFVRAVVPEVSADEARIRVLMPAVKTDKQYDEDGDEVDKTSEEIASEKAELLALLKAELVISDLGYERTQMMLRLERLTDA